MTGNPTIIQTDKQMGKAGIRRELFNSYITLKNLGAGETLDKIYSISLKSGYSHKDRIGMMQEEVKDASKNEIIQLNQFLNTYNIAVMDKRKLAHKQEFMEKSNSTYESLYPGLKNQVIEIDNNPTTNIKKDDFYSSRGLRPGQRNAAFSRIGELTGKFITKHKKGLTYAAVGAVAVAGMISTYFIGDNIGTKKGVASQQPIINSQTQTINKKQKTINNLEKTLDVKDKEINDYECKTLDYQSKLTAAGRPDAEVIKETVEKTTSKLKAQYETQIKKADQQMKDSVDKLLAKQECLENKLTAAGRPDEEVRTESREHYKQHFEQHYRIHYGKVAELAKEKAQKKVDALSLENKELKEDYVVLENEKAASDVQLNECIGSVKDNSVIVPLLDVNDVDSNSVTGLVQVTDANEGVLDPNTAYYYSSDSFCADEIPAGAQLIDPIVTYADGTTRDFSIQPNENCTTNLASVITPILADANECDPCKRLEEFGIVKEHYMTEPWTYGNELKEKQKKHWKDGEGFSWLWTGLARAGTQINDIIEIPVTTVTAAGGAVWGTASNLLGNKNDGFDAGWKNGEKFGKSRMDSFYGGRSKWVFDDRLLNLDLEGAINVPYCTEKTELGGHVKLAEIVWWDFIAPFVANDIFSSGGGNNNGPTGGIIREGGEVNGGLGSIGGSTR